MLFMGIDAGTQGVRAVVADETGKIEAQEAKAYAQMNVAQRAGCFEQSPEDWWEATCTAIGSCVAQLEEKEITSDAIVGVCVAATSGTVLPLGANNEPLGDAIMSNDMRAKAEAREIHERCNDMEEWLGCRFNASFALPRLLWYARQQPEIYKKTALFCHQSDFLTGRLCGEFGLTDYNSAQRTGYDAQESCWPREIDAVLGLDMKKFPRVIAPGEQAGEICSRAARDCGLRIGTPVIAGTTDATASAFAAGAVHPGDWVSVIGTTFTLRGVVPKRVLDPAGAGYSYRIPGGNWMTGGASNLGGRCLNDFADRGDFVRSDRLAAELIPTGVRCYPLYGKGERFPFSDPEAEGFYLGNLFGGRMYAALMEGVAFGERLACEHMAGIGCPVGDSIYAVGGAARSRVWLKIRASVLGRCIRVPAAPGTAMGAAMLAASGRLSGLENAVDAMASFSRTLFPDEVLTRQYEELYQSFRAECKVRYGY